MSIYEKRIEKIRDRIIQDKLAGVILFPSPNQYYATGFRTSPGERLLLTIIPAKGEPFFIAPKLYEGQVKAESFIEDVICWKDEENPYEILRGEMEKRGLCAGKFAVDDTMWSQQLLSIMNVLPQIWFVPLEKIMSGLRLKKTEEEIEKIRKASKIVDDVVLDLKEYIKPGMTEIEIAAFMEYQMRKRGSEGPSFETIVGSGPNSALPHYNPGERKIGKGEFVVLDFGATFGGYCSDNTRTMCIGEPTEKMLEVYEIVRKAQEIGVKTVKPGLRAYEVDRAVRKHIEDSGYGEYYTHRTGHGLGLQVHEEPYISGIGETILEEGMVFSIEPGIYIEGEFGVRIEDIVVVTKDGCERFNNSPREVIKIK